jgi:hypothetical protein
MRKIALGLTAAGGVLIIESRIAFIYYRMLRHRPSEQDRSTGEGFRRIMGPASWVGLFLGLLGLVLFLLSLVET